MTVAKESEGSTVIGESMVEEGVDASPLQGI